MASTYNLFISHSWSYSDTYDKLKELLDTRPYFFFKNYSVPKDDPIHTNGTDKQLYDAIKNKIQLTHVVVIMTGVYASYSKWINKEIEIAQGAFATATPILAVTPLGAKRTSTIVNDAADLIVGWNSKSIVKGIRQLG